MLSVTVGFPADLAKPAVVSGGDECGGGLGAAAAFLLAVKSALTAEHCGARDWRVSVS